MHVVCSKCSAGSCEKVCQGSDILGHSIFSGSPFFKIILILHPVDEFYFFPLKPVSCTSSPQEKCEHPGAWQKHRHKKLSNTGPVQSSIQLLYYKFIALLNDMLTP